MKPITFNDLLTDPKYREMKYEDFHDFWHSDQISQRTVNIIYEKLGKPKGLASHECWLHLQKLKAESEKKSEPINTLHKVTITNQYARELISTHFTGIAPNEIKIEP